MKKTFKGRAVISGTATLKALVTHEGFNTLASYKNCKDGYNVCTDQNNKELYGKSTVGVALCLPQTIGSTTGGMVLFNSAASVWTPNVIPTVDDLGDEFLDYVKDGMTIEIAPDGTVTAE